MNGDIDIQISDMLKKSRSDSGKSQAYLSEKLNVSRKTIENWENGTKSPSMKNIVNWFRALGLDLVRYMNPILHPNETFTMQSVESTKSAIISIINSMSEQELNMLFFLMCGGYSGSSLSVMELATAYLHLPLRDRICIAEDIVLSYELDESVGRLKNEEFVKPNTKMVHIAIKNAMEAVRNGDDNYTSLMER